MGDRHDKRRTESILNGECRTIEVKTHGSGDSQELSLGERASQKRWHLSWALRIEEEFSRWVRVRLFF